MYNRAYANFLLLSWLCFPTFYGYLHQIHNLINKTFRITGLYENGRDGHPSSNAGRTIDELLHFDFCRGLAQLSAFSDYYLVFRFTGWIS